MENYWATQISTFVGFKLEFDNLFVLLSLERPNTSSDNPKTS